MALSSKWLDALQAQFLAGQETSPYGPGIDPAGAGTDTFTPDGASRYDASPSAVGSTSGLAPQAGSSSFMQQLRSGVADSGVRGGLAALVADPNAERSGGANNFDMFSGILKSVGRALGSAYGNPGFGIAAQAAEDRANYQNGILAQQQRETDEALKIAAEKRARAASIQRAMEGIDPTTKAGNAKAVAILAQMGEHEVAKNVAGLYREEEKAKAPQSRTRDVGSEQVFEEFDPATGQFKEVSRAPRWNPRTGSGGGGGDGSSDLAPAPENVWDTPPLDPRNKQAAISARTLGRNLEADSKDFITLQTSQRQLDEMESATTPGAEIATLYSFIKQLDPGSVVREGEVALSTAGMSYFDRLGLAYKKVGDGGVVSRNMKADLISTARKLYRASLPAQIDREKRAFNVGSQLGVPPSALGGSRLTQGDWDAAYGAGSAAQAAGETRTGDPKVDALLRKHGL